jgi:hypothetical protein
MPARAQRIKNLIKYGFTACTYRSGPIKFELSAVVVIRRAWKKKAQEVKPWSNFMNGASKS